MKRARVDVFESHEEEDEERKYFIKVVCIDGSIPVDHDFGALQNRVLRGEAWSDDDKNTISMPLIVIKMFLKNYKDLELYNENSFRKRELLVFRVVCDELPI